MRISFVLLVIGLYSTTTTADEIDVKRCNCYMLGTFETPDGKSLCEVSTGKCSCLKNVVGTNCDKCKEGYFGLLSGQGCAFCRCNMLGSLRQECDDISGKCTCKRGYIGHKCEKCINESPIINGKCCECPKISSKSKSCDSKGKCACKPHTSGAKCGKCDENYYHHPKNGCTPCHECYNNVKSATTTYNTTLNAKIAAINATNITAITEENAQFTKTLNSLKQKVAKLPKTAIKVINPDLYANVASLVDDLDAIEAKLQQNSDARKRIGAKIDAVNGKFGKANSLLKSGVKLVKGENAQIERLNGLVLKAELIMTGLEKRELKTEKLSKLVKDMEKLQHQTETKLNANSHDLTNLNDEIDKIKRFINEIKSSKTEVVQHLNMAKDLKEKVTKLQFYVSLETGDSDFIKTVEETVDRFKIPNVDVDLEKVRRKMEEVDELVDEIEERKRERIDVVDDFMKTYEDMKELLTNMEEVIKLINELENAIAKKPELSEEEKKLEEIVQLLQKILQDHPYADYEEKLSGIELIVQEISTLEDEMKRAITMYEEWITFLKAIPLYDDELDQVEGEIEALEKYYEELEYFRSFKLNLELEIAGIEKLLAGLPEEKNWCNPGKTIT